MTEQRITDRSEMVSLLKAQQWEKCKGELRAFMALEGSKYPEWTNAHERVDNCMSAEIERAIYGFINEIEENGLHE